LEIDGKAYISDKHKAEKFAKTYRSFSKLPTRKEDNNRAAGRDDIPYEMIKNLGPKAQDMLLDIYRRCWRGEGIP